MGNETLPINVSIQTNETPILYVLIPVMIAPMIGLLTWWVRGYTEKLSQHRENQKKYLIDSLQRQITQFYWPMYLKLIRYQQFVARLKEFKEGHFSLSRIGGDSPESKTKSLSQSQVSNPPQLDLAIVLPTAPQLVPISSGHSQMSTLGPNVNSAKIQVIERFNQAILKYESQQIETLRELQQTYTQFTPIAEPDGHLLMLLGQLDEFITYKITLHEVAEHTTGQYNAIIEDKLTRATYPNEVFACIRSRLAELQKQFNDLICNQHSQLLLTQSHMIGIKIAK
jgi:hypothetical protein